ncbi:MAG: hypothetical protein QXX87_05605 [Candidatus Jordarchaeales archaeon]
MSGINEVYRVSLLLEELNDLVRRAASIVEGTFFEFVLKWYLSGFTSEADEAVWEIRELVVQYGKLALRLLQFLQDLNLFVITGGREGERAGLLRTELEALTSRINEAFIVAAHRINEFEGLLEAVGLLERSRRVLVEAVNEWDGIKKSDILVLYSVLLEGADLRSVVSSINACRRFVSKFIGVFDLLNLREKYEGREFELLEEMGRVGELLFDFLWMAAIAGYHAARSIRTLVSEIQGEIEAEEAMKKMRNNESVSLVIRNSTSVEEIAFTLVRVRQEIEDALSAIDRAVELGDRVKALLDERDESIRSRVIDAYIRLREWREKANLVLEDVLNFQNVIEKRRKRKVQKEA